MKDQNSADKTTAISETFTASVQRVITVDVARYDEYLRESDMSPEQKEEVLRAMLSILLTFVDLGFGVHPLQQVGEKEPCGKDEKAGDQGAKDAFDRVRSKAKSKIEPKSRTGPEGRLEV
jgi:hypothetical protein